MAILTSHILNGTDGTHAGGIKVTFSKLGEFKIFETKTDEGGRLKSKIDSVKIDSFATYELVFETGPYWIDRGFKQIMDQVVFKTKKEEGWVNHLVLTKKI